ncbi:uncharacterized protein [Diabrotica undecimpunctata]|uniref:uncharacterized protein n=1 Tax=Diabrotica undecimpunctata TaxID=50387 RepID=UPI003B641E33
MDVDFNTDLFIDEVEKRPAIWNLNSKEYSNKILKKRAWQYLVLIFCNDGDTEEKKKLRSTLQKKWKNLRDVYVRDMKKIKTLKSSSTATSKSTSAYFQTLTFLQPTVQKRKSDSSFQVEDDNNKDGDVPESAEGNSDSNFRPPGEYPPATKKYKLHPANEHFAKILEKSINQRRPIEKEEDDEDKLFCLSLLKELKKVPEHNRLRL